MEEAEGAHGHGPLEGLRIVEMAGLGPVPLAGLILAEMGARVLRIERKDAARAFLDLPPAFDLDRHGRDVVQVDLKSAEGTALALRLIGEADCLIEGFRPGVMERLGLGPEVAMARNPRLVYGRMTGFGQTGPLAGRAGHDLTYLALTGILHAIGHEGGRPVPPLNLVADYGGGTMFLVTGLLAALVRRSISGRGQVIDAAMMEGAAMLAAPYAGFMASGMWQDRRGANLLDSGAPFYDTYETADGRHVAVACLEPQFFAEFARLLPLPGDLARRQYDRSCWPQLRTAIAERFKAHARDHWQSVFESSDACVAPVLNFAEARSHAQAVARGSYAQRDGLDRPVPAPRFSDTPTTMAGPARRDVAMALAGFGMDERDVQALVSQGVLGA
jgi:alpha-methylacyl-CoA racemase